MKEFINGYRFKYLTVLVCFSNAIIKAKTRKNLGSRGYIWLSHPGHGPSMKKIRAGTEAKNHKARLLPDPELLSGPLSG